MYGLKGHINCVKKIENFKEQLPEQFNILVEDEVVETRGTRFTLIGNARKDIKRIQTTNGHLDDAVNFEQGMTCRLKCPACWRTWNADTLKADTQVGRRTNQKYDDVKIILETFGKIDACGNMSDPIYWIPI